MGKVKKAKVFPIVAIGASAGGLRAFEEFLGALPPEPGMAFVLVPHLAPQFKSHLAEILARNTRLPVSEIESGDKVSPGRIYILPPNRALLIKKGILRLSGSGVRLDRRNPIDSFFLSLAADQGKRAVGILLSGEGSDGTEGLRAIKENGGITYAQDEKTAEHLSMPHSAVLSGCVDFILSPAEIAAKLVSARYGRGRSRDGRGARSKPGLDGALGGILDLLRTAKGVEFKLYKQSTLRRRIQRRMAVAGLRDPAKYLRALKADPKELQQLYHDILISVTSFFREPESFRDLKSTIYPRLMKNRSSDAPVRIWVPGCSTGEEAYSHAMNLLEYLGARAALVPFQIFATDVNPSVIERARSGLYSRKLRAELSQDRLRRFFVKTKDGYAVIPAIRERCVFAVQNLVQDPPFTNLDLISCRNLLIYLGPELQEKALKIFQYALKPRGILMLGRSEAIGDFSGRFSPLAAQGKVFSERTSASRAPLDFIPVGRFLQTGSALKDPGPGAPGSNRPGSDLVDLQTEVENILPPRYRPNGIIVNGELEILRFLGNTSAYLHPAPGKPGLNLRRMAQGEFLLELRAALHMARKSARAVKRDIAAPAGGPRGRVRIEVLPLKPSDLHNDYFLVLFEEVTAADSRSRRTAMEARGKESSRVSELEEDLAVSGEHLKSIIEEQESTNAQLKAANEELLSGNEELQSINEEFETSKEELQSANEELITSTEEAVRANQILSRANSDFSNLLDNIDISVVLLAPDLTIRRYTPPAEKTLKLTPDKNGRCIADIKLPLRLQNLRQLLQNAIRTGCVQELEVQNTQGRWYYLVIRPYRTATTKIDGAVMTLIDINDRKRWKRNVLRLATLVHDSNDAVIIRDRRDRIIAWNTGAHKMYGYPDAEALERSLPQLIPEKERPRMKELVRQALRGKEVAQIETKRRAKDGRLLDVLLTVTMLRNEKGRPVELATTERDITEQKKASRELRTLHSRVISAQETERRRFARELHDGVGQILSGVKFRLESLAGKNCSGGRAAAKILRLGGLLDRAISEIRRVSQDLMPSELELGLEPALRALCREFKERSKIQMTLRTELGQAGLAAEPALALFRIAQEALNNIGKHSRASRMSLILTRSGKELVLSVSDNGIGFTPGRDRRTARRGIGLGNMRERAESVGGFFELQSAPGSGTMLRAHIPLSGLGEDTL